MRPGARQHGRVSSVNANGAAACSKRPTGDKCSVMGHVNPHTSICPTKSSPAWSGAVRLGPRACLNISEGGGMSETCDFEHMEDGHETH